MADFATNPVTISGKSRIRTPSQALSSRFVFLNIQNAEPNLGVPQPVSPSPDPSGIRYALLSNNSYNVPGSAWRVWSYNSPRIAAYSNKNSLGIGENANPIRANSVVYNNHPYGTNRYNSESLAENSFNVYSLSGIYLFDSTTIGDPASAVSFVVTEDGQVGINTQYPYEYLTLAGNLSSNGTLSGVNLSISRNSVLGNTKNVTNVLRGTVRFADTSNTSILFGNGDANYDVNLYRAAANVLRTDDTFVCQTLSTISGLSAGTLSTAGGTSDNWNSSFNTVNSISAFKIDNVISSDYTFSDSDNTKTYHVDTSSGILSGIFPSTLSNNFSVNLILVSTNVFVVSSSQTPLLSSNGNKVNLPFSSVLIYKYNNILYGLGNFY